MLLDSLLQFSNAQALTASAISANVIDLGPLGGVTPANLIRDIGAGEPLHLSILVSTGLDSAAEGATLVVTLESDSTADLATSATVHWTSGTLTEASVAAAGTWIAKGLIIPPGNYERYLGLRYTVAVENFTSGNVKAWLHKGRFDDRTYEAGFSTGVN